MSNDFSLGQVQVALSPQERFEEYLQSRGKRITQQRRVLVDHVFERHDHFDADELVASLSGKPEAGAVSRPTVYRTLNELVEAGLFYCQMCEKLIEFHSEELADLRDAVAREHNFRVASHRLTIFGVCRECSRTRHRRQSPMDLV
jgi:Fur family transcriptional regulator, ferric uptake regulator